MSGKPSIFTEAIEKAWKRGWCARDDGSRFDQGKSFATGKAADEHPLLAHAEELLEAAEAMLQRKEGTLLMHSASGELVETEITFPKLRAVIARCKGKRP